MSSNLKVDISREQYNKLKNLPQSEQKPQLLKAVAEAAKAAGYTKANLLKETTCFAYEINTKFGTVSASSKKSTVIQDMARDIKHAKEHDELEQEKVNERANSSDEKSQNNDEKSNNEKDSNDKDSNDKDSNDKDSNEKSGKQKDNKRKPLTIYVSENLKDKIKSLPEQEGKDLLRAQITQQAILQGCTMEDLKKYQTGCSLSSGLESTSCSTPNGSTALDNMVEIIYAGILGKSLQETKDAVEAADNKKANAKGAIDRMVNPIYNGADLDVELQQEGMAPSAFTK